MCIYTHKCTYTHTGKSDKSDRKPDKILSYSETEGTMYNMVR